MQAAGSRHRRSAVLLVGCKTPTESHSQTQSELPAPHPKHRRPSSVGVNDWIACCHNSTSFQNLLVRTAYVRGPRARAAISQSVASDPCCIARSSHPALNSRKSGLLAKKSWNGEAGRVAGVHKRRPKSKSVEITCRGSASRRRSKAAAACDRCPEARHTQAYIRTTAIAVSVHDAPNDSQQPNSDAML